MALGVLEHADAGVDLERRAQFDVHGAHEVVLLQQQQRLPVNLLCPELLCDLLAACEDVATFSNTPKATCAPPNPLLPPLLTRQRTDELIDILHVPLAGLTGQETMPDACQVPHVHVRQLHVAQLEVAVALAPARGGRAG